MLYHLGPSLLSNWGTALQYTDTDCPILFMHVSAAGHLCCFHIQCLKCLSFNVDIYSPFSLVDNAAGSYPQMCVQNALRGWWNGLVGKDTFYLSFLSRTQSQKRRIDFHKLSSDLHMCDTAQVCPTHTQNKQYTKFWKYKKWMKQFTFNFSFIEIGCCHALMTWLSLHSPGWP